MVQKHYLVEHITHQVNFVCITFDFFLIYLTFVFVLDSSKLRQTHAFYDAFFSDVPSQGVFKILKQESHVVPCTCELK